MTTPTTQPDRCDQIAREITSGPCGSYIFSDGVLRLRKEIATALQAAEQRGREEGLELRILVTELCDALVGHGTAGAIDGEKVDAAHAKVFEFLVRNPIGQSQQQPKSEPSRECEQIGEDIASGNFGNEELPYEIPHNLKATLARRIAAALQAKQDELDALREEVLGVLSNLIRACDGLAEQQAMPDDHYEQPLRDAKALRDKLKASQPTLPQPQTPHQ